MELFVSIENIIFAGEEFLHHLLDLINNITAQDSIPELVKVGLLNCGDNLLFFILHLLQS
jgi:hypothetical protein